MKLLEKARSRVRDDHFHFKDHQNEARLFRRRVIVCGLFLTLMCGLMLHRYHHLQIDNFQRYSTQSDRNRLQLRPIAPNRGLFYDAKGRILAENRAVNTLSVTVERTKDLDAALVELGKLVSLSDADKESFKKALKWRRRPYQSIPLKYHLSDEELARIAVDEYRFDGVNIDGQLVRHYPYGALFTHVVGYVGRINEREQSAFSQQDLALYEGTNSIGKIGLEKSYEKVLLGIPGRETIETDARGRVLKVVEQLDPVAGKNIELFLDLDVQKIAAQAMDGRRGAVVALDIATGGVLAMLSSPSYNPNLFVTGISSKDYSALNTSRDLPLFNRSIQGQYPPGSTIKPMLGLSALDAGMTTATRSVPDPGFYQLENDERLYREWKKGGHGKTVDLYQAIVESCDIFFYDVGFRMGVDRMHAFGLYFGLGQLTHIDIPSERSALWPSREWKKRERGASWYPGNSLNMSIGQGDVLTTPLQLAAMTATLARRGQYIGPRLARTIGGEKTVAVAKAIYPIHDEHWDLVLKSMKDVVHSVRGTAQSIRRGLTFTMAGKTGTAQVVGIAQDEEYDSEALSERNRDHALFIGYAPFENPQIAVAVVIENGEKSSKAGLVARKVMETYLEGKKVGQ